MSSNTVVVRILAVAAIVQIVLSAIAWLVFLGGFGYLTNDAIPGSDTSLFTGPLWDPYWAVSVLSPFLFAVMIAKSILMIIKDELFRKYFIIHILAVIAIIITVIVLCFLGAILILQRNAIQTIQDSKIPNVMVPGYISALFAGALLEVFFLGGTWICHIIADLCGGTDKDNLY